MVLLFDNVLFIVSKVHYALCCTLSAMICGFGDGQDNKFVVFCLCYERGGIDCSKYLSGRLILFTLTPFCFYLEFLRLPPRNCNLRAHLDFLFAVFRFLAVRFELFILW